MPDVIQDYATRSAQATPDAPYVTAEGKTRTYAWLDTRSSQLANLLLESGCKRGDRIALALPKGADAILAMHGTLKAGCAYVPLDISSPLPRLQRIITAAEPRLLLGERATLGLAEELKQGSPHAGISIGTLSEPPADPSHSERSFTKADIDSMSAEAPTPVNSSDDIAHILFTSGSTGHPKGVPILHRNVVAFIDWGRQHFGLSASDRMSGHSPFHFDLSTFDIYGAAAVGAQLFLVASELNLAPARLAAFMRAAHLTQWFSVPSALTLLAKFDAIPSGSLPHLRRLIWCGEVLPTSTLRYWMRVAPEATFTNLYGPTEATIASSYYDVAFPPGSDLQEIPIGVGCAGEEILVLDDDLQTSSAGELGEIHIGGAGVAPGYWRDDTATAAAYVPDPRSPSARLYRTGDLGRTDSEGLTWFVGRKDTQIKSRGYRIELGEIETALSAIDELADACVVGIPTEGFEGTTICCAYAPRGQQLSSAAIRTSLSVVLPSYMLPTRWLELHELPKNANGKVDRPRVRSMFEEAARASGDRT